MVRGASLVVAASVAAALVACSTDRTSREASSETAHASLTATPDGSVLLRWGSGANEVGLRPAVAERAAFGVPAVAVGANGEAILLDAVNERVVRVTADRLTTIARAPKDADDLAVSADGAIALHRSTTPKITVLDPAGEAIGEVDASPAGDVDAIALGPSRRVIVTSALQESFPLGSPSVAAMPSAVLAHKREGAALLPGGDGLTTVVNGGRAELRVVAQANGERARVRATHALGEAQSARIVGASGNVACVRREHVDTRAEGPIAVKRDALCLDASTGARLFETELAAPGLYVPRRELALGSGKLVFVHPEKDGLRVSTWTVGGAR